MNLENYLQAREIVVSVSPIFKGIGFFLSFLLFLSCFLPFLRKKVRLTMLSSLLFLMLGFIFTLYFHYEISRNVFFESPSIPGIRVSLYAPLWIESEKLFFWLLLYFLFAVTFLKKATNMHLETGIFLTSAIFMALVSFLDPFSNPLPQLHNEIISFSNALTHFNIPAIMSFVGRIQHFYNTPYMWIHPPLLFASYALFLLALPAFILGLFSSINTAIDYERFAYSPMKLGYILLTVGMLVGYPWALEAWQGSAWWWSPKINTSIMMWLLYTAYMHSRIYMGRKGFARLTCVLGIISFTALIFTYITTYLIPGVHSYG